MFDGFLIEVDTLGLSTKAGYTEKIEVRKIGDAAAKIADYLAYVAANSGERQTATIRVYGSNFINQKAALIRTCEIKIHSGLTVKNGKTAYFDYSQEAKRVTRGIW